MKKMLQPQYFRFSAVQNFQIQHKLYLIKFLWLKHYDFKLLYLLYFNNY